MTYLSGFSADLFSGKQVVVTGAAGGIGRAIAAAFAACGAKLIQIDRLESIPLENKGWIGCDLADRGALKEAAACIFGPISALINCAGVFRRMPMSEAGAETEWDRTLAINLTAPFLLTRALLPQLTGGAVVNITSVRAETSAERASAYTVSKGGLAALTLSMADELATLGIRANAVAPGDVDTAMGHTDPDITAKLFARTPLKRMARPEEVAAACVFLASPLAAHITGATLRVDGGFLAV
jgi:NAD(P)-dependent dehydrogenase (short-subunit alcohol dehydrogenase family)